jgi:hypothetical protein
LARLHQPYFVTPAKAGVHTSALYAFWIPAFEGVAKREKTSCPRKRASRKLRKSNWFWTPAFAGVTEKRAFATPSFAEMTIAGQPVIFPVARY